MGVFKGKPDLQRTVEEALIELTMSSAFFSQRMRWDDKFAPSRGVTGVSTVLIHRRAPSWAGRAGNQDESNEPFTERDDAAMSSKLIARRSDDCFEPE